MLDVLGEVRYTEWIGEAIVGERTAASWPPPSEDLLVVGAR